MSRRDDIIHAATKVLAEKGFNKATMDDIALECGVSKGTLYLYFSSKNALIAAIYLYELNLYLQAVMQASFHQGTPPEKLQKFLEFVESSFRGQPDLLKLFPELITHLMQNPGWVEADKMAAEETLNVLKAILDEGISGGYFRPLDTSTAAATILGAAFGVLIQGFFYPEQDLKRSLEYLTDIIVKGLSHE